MTRRERARPRRFFARRAPAALFVLAALFASASAADKADYDRRNAERYRALFAYLDRDANRTVTLAEAEGDLDFGVIFNDMDIDRDGSVTAAELARYIDQRFGARA
jgi:hypothetical protein